MSDITNQATVDTVFLKAKALELEAALREVEWIPSEIDGELHCAWCYNMKLEGHVENCTRQNALGMPPELTRDFNKALLLRRMIGKR